MLGTAHLSLPLACIAINPLKLGKGEQMKVMKFGGTSVGKPERMHHIVTLVNKQTEPAIVVLSALSGTTNAFVEIGENIAKGDRAAAKAAY